MRILDQAAQTLQRFRENGRTLRQWRMSPSTYARLRQEIAESMTITELLGVPIVVTEELDPIGRDDLVSA